MCLLLPTVSNLGFLSITWLVGSNIVALSLLGLLVPPLSVFHATKSLCTHC